MKAAEWNERVNNSGISSFGESGWLYAGSEEEYHYIAFLRTAYVYVGTKKIAGYDRYRVPIDAQKVVKPQPRIKREKKWIPLREVVEPKERDRFFYVGPRTSAEFYQLQTERLYPNGLPASDIPFVPTQRDLRWPDEN